MCRIPFRLETYSNPLSKVLVHIPIILIINLKLNEIKNRLALILNRPSNVLEKSFNLNRDREYHKISIIHGYIHEKKFKFNSIISINLLLFK